MAFLRDLQAQDDERTEALRALGGVILAVGALVLLFRKSLLTEPWGDVALLVAWLVPAVVLYGGGIAAARASEPRLWHAVWVVAGLGFIYGTLNQFITVIDGDTGAPLNVAWTLAVVAAAGVGAAILARVPFGWLVAGIALSIAWLAIWEEVLENGLGDDAGTFRGLCMVATLILVGLAWLVETRLERERSEAAELVTAAGIIFVVGAGFISLSGAGVSPVATDVAPTEGGVEPSLFWDLVLFGGSLLLIAAGAFTRLRGPVYVGAIGLFTFAVSAGLNLDDDERSADIVGWPLLLLAVAAAAIAASFLAAQNSAKGSGPPPGGPAGPPPVPPTAQPTAPPPARPAAPPPPPPPTAPPAPPPAAPPAPPPTQPPGQSGETVIDPDHRP